MGGSHQEYVTNCEVLPRLPRPNRPGLVRRYALPVVALAAVSTLAGFEAAHFHGSAKWASTDSVQAASLPDSVDTAKTSEEELNRLAPQQQAERLLERAIHRDTASLELIDKGVDTWRGRLQNTDHLFDLVHTALNADDLKVRGAAVEIDLAANNLSKSSESVSRLVHQLRDDPAGRPWALWRLAALGNRGVEPEIALAQ